MAHAAIDVPSLHRTANVDPVRLFAHMRKEGVLGEYAYLQVTPDHAELGWNPVERLTLLAGDSGTQWRFELKRLALRAKELGRNAVGYIGFDAIDRTVGSLPDGSVTGLPLIEFMIPSEVLTIRGESITHQGRETVNVDRCLNRSMDASWPVPCGRATLVDRTSDEAFVAGVNAGLEAIRCGAVQKVVLSRYEAYECRLDAERLLAALASPSCESYLLCFGDLVAVVPSPELFLAGMERVVVTNPLAGTRPRSDIESEDERLRAELLRDHKELVEHVLAVSTMLSELGRVCDPDTLAIQRFMNVVQQKRVQHLSSVLRGTILDGHDLFDVLWALFPSVTVTGLPRDAALRTIRTLEAHPRYLYAGAVGWMSGDDACRLMLSIRSIFQYRGRAFLQAGAGIVAGSVGERELCETTHKLAALKETLTSAAVADGRRAHF